MEEKKLWTIERKRLVWLTQGQDVTLVKATLYLWLAETFDYVSCTENVVDGSHKFILVKVLSIADE